MKLKNGMISVLLSAGLAGCGAMASTNLDPGLSALGLKIAYMSVKPGTRAKVARIYRTLSPTKEISVTTTFKQMCEDDFDQTAALKTIDTFVKTEPAAQTGFNDTAGRTYSGGVSGVNLDPVSLGVTGNVTAKRTVDIKDIKDSHLTDQGQATVASAIGDNCKKTIIEKRKQGYLVFIVTAATIAGTIDVTITYDKSISPTAAIKIAKDIAPGLNFTMGSNSTAVARYMNAVIELEPGTI